MHSGPKERTTPDSASSTHITGEGDIRRKTQALGLGERGEGDGEEVTTPTKSSTTSATSYSKLHAHFLGAAALLSTIALEPIVLL